MNATEVAKKLNVPVQTVRCLLKSGKLHGNKEKNKWVVKQKEFAMFRRKNEAVLNNIRNKYVNLYWAGLSVKQLQAHVAEDFAKEMVICRRSGFAERTIYDSLMRDKEGTT